MRRYKLLIILMVLALLLAACGSDDKDDTSSGDETGTTSTTDTEGAPSKLLAETLLEGDAESTTDSGAPVSDRAPEPGEPATGAQVTESTTASRSSEPVMPFPIPDVTTEERYGSMVELLPFFPKDTLVLLAANSDPAFIAQLDQWLDRIANLFPTEEEEMQPTPPFTALLDDVADSLVDTDFQSGIRPWLGDALAIGIYSPVLKYGPDDDYYYYYEDEVEVPIVLVMAITNRPGATRFVEQLLSEQLEYGDWSRSDEPGYTLFKPEYEYYEGSVIVRDDVLIISSSSKYDLLPRTSPFSPNMGDSTYFQSTVNLMAEESYNVMVYADTPLLIASLVGAEGDVDPAAGVLLTALIRMIGPDAIGATILDNRALVFDFTATTGNLAGIEALGVPTTMPYKAIDPGFLMNVPGSAALVIHGTDLNSFYEMTTNLAEAMSDQMAGEVGAEMLGPDVENLLAVVPNFILANLTGLSYERNIQHWLTGDYAMFVGYNRDFVPGADPSATNLPVDVGAVFQASDAAAAEEFIHILAREIELHLRTQGIHEIKLTEETLDGMPLLSLVLVDYDGTMLLEIVAGTNGSVVAFGTRNAVQDALQPSGDRFEPLQRYTLPNARMALYFETAPLTPAIDALTYYEAAPQDIQFLRDLAAFVEGASISFVTTPDGDVLLRMALITTP